MDYEGSVYIAVAENFMEYGACRDSIEKIVRREGDTAPQYKRHTKGYESRQEHLNNWYHTTQHPFILFLDGDMIFEPDTLERLRAHKKPYVSGFYMRRQVRPALPVWYEQHAPGVFPLRPLTWLLEENKTKQRSASGWGCILIHRDVVTATRKILKGEPEIIEDDMDVYPYDLDAVLAGKEQIRPLRKIKHDIVGSDIRFPFYARLAGFDLIGDTGVKPKHMTTYGVGLDDWMNQPAWVNRDLSLSIGRDYRQETQ